MGATKDPKPAGMYPVNVNDGTGPRSHSPSARPAGFKHSPSHNPSQHEGAGQRRTTWTLRFRGDRHKEKQSTSAEHRSEGFVWQQRRNPFVALLYGFDVGRADLKPAHTYYVDTLVAEIRGSVGKTWTARLEGRASRTGKDGANLTLSRDRAQRVAERLASQAPALDIEQKDWVGGRAASDAGDRDGKENLFHRAVLLKVWSTDVPPPPDPPPPPRRDPPKTKKTFKICVVKGDARSVSTPGIKTGSLGVDIATFRIWDVGRKMAADYRYMALLGGAGVGIDVFGLSESIYGGGAWSTFEAASDWTLEGFAGEASLSGIGVEGGIASAGYATFTFTQRLGSRWWPKIATQNIPNIDTGTSRSLPSIGASRGMAGTLAMKGTPFPYEGP
jgi:outer membrane protein OmpA-like peptidoglycan-associated protein